MILEQSSWGLEPGKSYPRLTQDLHADVVIVGAGLAGIFNAYILAKAGLKVVVLEKNDKILQNATMRTTAFITKIIDTSFLELTQLFGTDQAKLIWESGQDAINFIADIIKKENIDCEFKFVPAYTYAKDKKEFEGLLQEHKAIQEAGFEATLSEDGNKLDFRNSGFLQIPNQAQFHPLKFAQRLAELAESVGAKIFTNSEALTIDGQTVKTKTAQVQAKDILISTYKPLIQEGTHFKKGMYISYVYELEITHGYISEGMYFDMHNPYHYFRIDNYGTFDRMIIGGEDHRREIKINPGKNFNALEKYIKTVLGSNTYKITRKWSGHILEPSDGLALIGEIRPHTFVATAFSGNGMTYSAISTMIISDLILNQKNVYAKVYTAKRNPTMKQLFIKGSDYIQMFFGGAVKNFFSSR